MKKMKRIFSLVICTIIAFSMVGCGKSPSKKPENEKDDKKNITLSVAWWGGATRNERIQKTLDMYKELHPNITFTSATNNFTDHYTAMTTAAASQDLPDMWLVSTQLWLDSFASSKQLLNLTPYIESGALDVSNIPENALQSGRASDGNIYAIGAGYNTLCMQYNKTLLDKNGIEIKNDMTLDEFAEKCAEIYKKTGVKTTIDNADSFIEYLLRADDKIFYENGKLGADSADQLRPYFDLLERGRKEGWLIDYDTYVSAGGDTATQPIVTGKAWNAMWYSNQLSALQDPCPEGTVLDIVSCPTPDLTKSNYIRASMAWGIGANTKNPDEAVALLNYWINTEDVHKVVLGELGVPVNSKIAKNIMPLLDETNARVFDYVLNVSVPNSSLENPIGGTGADEVRKLVDELEEQMFYGSITAEDAANKLFKEGNALMGNK